MERQSIIEKAWETVDEIKEGPAYRRYLQSIAALGSDSELRDLVAAFNASKAAFEAIRPFGQHHPDFSAKAAALARDKDALFSRPEHQSYRNAQAELDEELARIGTAIQSVLDDCSVASKKTCSRR